MDISLFLTLFHIIGVAIGVGGATVSDVLFFRVLKDKKISADELGLLHTLGMMLWLGLVILIVSGLGFVTLQYVMSGTSSYLVSSWFQAKMTIIALLVTNACVMHWYVFPFMKSHLNTALTHKKVAPHFALLATTGVVSITSWYSALVLGVTRGLDFSYGLIINIYLTILLFGIMIAYIILSVAVFGKSVRKDDNDTEVKSIRRWPLVLFATILGVVLIVVSWYVANRIYSDGIKIDSHHHHDDGSFRSLRHADHNH